MTNTNRPGLEMNPKVTTTLKKRVRDNYVRDIEEHIESLLAERDDINEQISNLEERLDEKDNQLSSCGYIIIDGNPELDPVAREAWYLDVDDLDPADAMCDIIRWTFGLKIVASAYDKETNYTILRVNGNLPRADELYYVLVDDSRDEARLLDSDFKLVARETISHLDEDGQYA